MPDEPGGEERGERGERRDRRRAQEQQVRRQQGGREGDRELVEVRPRRMPDEDRAQHDGREQQDERDRHADGREPLAAEAPRHRRSR